MFSPPEKFGLVHGEGDYAGFEARVRLAPIPLSLSLSFQTRLASEDHTAILEAIREFGDTVLISWNVAVAAGPVPADGAGLLSQDFALTMALVKGWSEALTLPPLASDVLPVNGRTSGQGRSRRNGHTPSSSMASANGGAAPPAPYSPRTPH